MKKIFLLICIFAFAFGANFSLAEVNSVTPSTNDANRDKGWAHVNLVDADYDSITLQFVSTRSFWSCFEYRIDNEENTVIGSNPNLDILDGRWTQVCVNNSQTERIIQADEFVEVRMVYGAENDERFDWTRFDVLPEPGMIISPTEGQEVQEGEMLNLEAKDISAKNAGVQWAVRKGTCAAATNTVAGNVDGFSTPYTWLNGIFFASVDTANFAIGEYCLIFNPNQGDRLTQWFEIVEPETPTDPTAKEDCMKSGWENFGFKNQGQCIRYVETGKDSR